MAHKIEQPHLTQDGREHYLWTKRTTDPVNGEVFIADHPTVFEYAILVCPPSIAPRARLTLVNLTGATIPREFPNARVARDTLDAYWRTYPGYGEGN